jgi:putative tryptophan/tyrosine transport system substrate-binding protein
MPVRLIGLLLTLFIILAPPATEAQIGKSYRIGFLGPSSAPENASWLEALRHGLRELGDVEGQNIVIEPRYADGHADRLPDLAAELVRLNVDVIVAPNNPAVAAAQRATRTIPIVMVAPTDPVGSGFVASLPRPGGNITGLSSQFAEIGSKRFQLLREAVPNVSRIAVLWDPTEPGRRDEVSVIEDASRTSGVQLWLFEARSPQEIDRAFASMIQTGAGAAIVQGTGMLFGQRARIAEQAARHRLPSMCAVREFVEAGCLMSYSVQFSDAFRRAAAYVDKILKGSKPADLPVEQPRTFDLVINLKTAKALGLTIPQSLLLRADQIIE